MVGFAVICQLLVSFGFWFANNNLHFRTYWHMSEDHVCPKVAVTEKGCSKTQITNEAHRKHVCAGSANMPHSRTLGMPTQFAAIVSSHFCILAAY